MNAHISKQVSLFPIQRLLQTCIEINQVTPDNKFINEQKLRDLISDTLENSLELVLTQKSITLAKVINFIELMKYFQVKFGKRHLELFTQFEINPTDLFQRVNKHTNDLATTGLTLSQIQQMKQEMVGFDIYLRYLVQDDIVPEEEHHHLHDQIEECKQECI